MRVVVIVTYLLLDAAPALMEWWKQMSKSVLTSWLGYRLIGCWNRWCTLCSNTSHWRLDKQSHSQRHQLASVKLRQDSLHRCNFSPYNILKCFVSSWIVGVNSKCGICKSFLTPFMCTRTLMNIFTHNHRSLKNIFQHMCPLSSYHWNKWCAILISSSCNTSVFCF